MDVIETGKGNLTIVAVHGIQGTRASWTPLATAMQDEARFVLPNLRGRAEAARGKGPEDYTLDGFADDLERTVRDHVGERPYLLAGWSMGVSVSLQYLARGGVPRPRGVLLMSGTPTLDRARWFTARGPALVEEIAERERRLALVAPADRQAVAWTWESIGGTSQLGLLRTVREPVLIVHGRDDEDSPYAHAEALAAGLPDATLVGLSGIGHSILKDATADVAHHLRVFIARLNWS